MYHGGLLSGGGGGGVEVGCFQVFEVAHLELSIGTPIANGTVVEKHWSKRSIYLTFDFLQETVG